MSVATHKDRLIYLNSSWLEKYICNFYMINRNVNLSRKNLRLYYRSFLTSLLGLSEPPTGILGAWSWPWGGFLVVFLNLNVIYPHQPMIYFGNHGIYVSGHVRRSTRNDLGQLSSERYNSHKNSKTTQRQNAGIKFFILVDVIFLSETSIQYWNSNCVSWFAILKSIQLSSIHIHFQ